MGRWINVAVLVGIFSLMVVSLVHESGFQSITGNAVRDSSSVYDFLIFVDNHPEQFQVVVGKNAKDYEIENAKKISDHFGTVFNTEKDVKSRENLILFGNPNTNSLLDKIYSKSYNQGDNVMTVEKNNLVIVVSGALQAERVQEMLMNYKNQRQDLLLSEARVGIADIMGVIVMVTVAIVSLFILFVDVHRRRSIKRDKQRNMIEEIQDYVVKYAKEGRNILEIKQWLVTRGYDSKLIDVAIQNVRTNLSSQTN